MKIDFLRIFGVILILVLIGVALYVAYSVWEVKRDLPGMIPQIPKIPIVSDIFGGK